MSSRKRVLWLIFIGDVNISECTVAQFAATDSGGHKMVLDMGSVGELNVEDKQPVRSFVKNEKVWFAVRPEKVNVSKEKPVAEPGREINSVEGKVLDIAYSGNTSTYHVELSDGSIFKAQAANQRRYATAPLPGMTRSGYPGRLPPLLC